MAYKVNFTKSFNKDVEKCSKRGYNMSRQKNIIPLQRNNVCDSKQYCAFLSII